MIIQPEDCFGVFHNLHYHPGIFGHIVPDSSTSGRLPVRQTIAVRLRAIEVLRLWLEKWLKHRSPVGILSLFSHFYNVMFYLKKGGVIRQLTALFLCLI